MRIEPLSPLLGARVEGIDLARDVTEEAVHAIREAFHRYRLLLFRGQRLDAEQQSRFARHFGPLASSGKYIDPGKQVLFLSNTRKDGVFGDGELLFHSDHSYFDKPDIRAIVLYAIEIPASGGDTLFIDAERAYRELPADRKHYLERLHALHVWAPTYAMRPGPDAASQPNVQRAVHPIVRTEPHTGLRTVYVNMAMTHSIVGLPPENGEKLLQELFAYLYREEVQYRHRWQVDDLLIWDNRLLQHARTTFDPSEPRTLRRSPVAEAI